MSLLTLSQILGTTTQQINLEKYIGAVIPFKNPYVLFLNTEQLVDTDEQYIYFCVYVMGNRKVVAWGVYNKYAQTFSFEGGCKFKLPQIINMYNTWKESGYDYLGNYVIDRINKKITKYAWGNSSTLKRDEYLKYKAFFSFLNGKITRELFERKYMDFLNDIEDKYGEDFLSNKEFEDYEDRLRKQIDIYERSVNRLDLDNTLANKLSKYNFDNIMKITDRFYDMIKYGKLEEDEYYYALENCPELYECETEIMENCAVYYNGQDPYYRSKNILS